MRFVKCGSGEEELRVHVQNLGDIYEILSFLSFRQILPSGCIVPFVSVEAPSPLLGTISKGRADSADAPTVRLLNNRAVLVGDLVAAITQE